MNTACTTTCSPTTKKIARIKREDGRVLNAKTKLVEWMGRLPKLEFTSGDVTSFIDDRPTYQMAWDMIREGTDVSRVGPVRGKATTWRRGSAKPRITPRKGS